MTFVKDAQSYFDKGMYVVPITPKSKVPLIKDWPNIDFEKVINKYEGYGIAIKCGKSGIMALDIDIEDEAIKEKIRRILPPILCGKIGNPNRLPTIFFQKEEKFKDLKTNGIELIIDARICVIPNTIHPITNKPYYWVGKSLLEISIDELPLLDEKLLNDILILSGNKNKSVNEVTKSDGTRSNHGSHVKLMEVAMACIQQNLSPDEVVKALLDHDEKINEKISYFLCPSDPRNKSNNKTINAYTFAMRCFESNLKKGEIKKVPLERSYEFELKLSESSIEKEAEVKEYKKYFKKLPKLTGLGKIIFDELYNNSPVARSQFCFMQTINLLSLLVGNKLRYKGTSCNLYQYGLGGTGMGKDFSFRHSKKILEQSELGFLIGTSSPTSETVVLKLLENQKVQCFFVNEAESVLKRIKNDRTNFGLRECLTDLYDSNGGLTASKTLMSAKNGIPSTEKIGGVFAPFLNLCFTSTIAAFKDNMGIDLFDTGFGSRFLFYSEDRFKDEKYLEDYSPGVATNVTDAVKKFFRISNSFDFSEPKDNFEIKNIRVSDEAKKFDRDLFDRLVIEKRKYKDDKFFGIISRKNLLISKFALIHHCMINFDKCYEDIELSKESLVWAELAVEAVTFNMREFLKDNVSRTIYGKQSNEIYLFIKRRTSEKKETRKMNISNQFNTIEKTLRSKLIEDLLEQEKIFRDEKRCFWAKC